MLEILQIPECVYQVAYAADWRCDDDTMKELLAEYVAHTGRFAPVELRRLGIDWEPPIFADDLDDLPEDALVIKDLPPEFWRVALLYEFEEDVAEGDFQALFEARAKDRPYGLGGFDQALAAFILEQEVSLPS